MLGILLRSSKRSPQACVTCSLHPSSASQNQTTRQLVISRPRRHSSSKPSSPSRGDSTSIPTSASPTSKDVANGSRKRSSSKTGRPKSRDGQGKPGSMNTISTLPSVPSTQHLHSQDITLASFFSQHRPISVIAPVPPTSSQQAFSAIFSPASRTKSTEVSFTISSAVGRPELKLGDQNGASDLRSAVTQASLSNAEGPNSDSQTLYINMEELTKNFRPFNPPPPPEAVGKMKKTNSQYRGLTDSITQDSQSDAKGDAKAAVHRAILVPYFDRMRTRQHQWLDKTDHLPTLVWNTLSVRRQRRLKMKKHKFKKLLKRTRNLRRKLDKL